MSWVWSKFKYHLNCLNVHFNVEVDLKPDVLTKIIFWPLIRVRLLFSLFILTFPLLCFEGTSASDVTSPKKEEPEPPKQIISVPPTEGKRREKENEISLLPSPDSSHLGAAPAGSKYSTELQICSDMKWLHSQGCCICGQGITMKTLISQMGTVECLPFS